MKQQLADLTVWIRKIIRKKFRYESEDLPFYIGIITAVIVFVIGLNAFVELTDELAENELTTIDAAVADYIHAFRTERLTLFFTFITHLGDRFGYVVIIILLAVFFLIRHHSWKFTVQTLLVLLLSTFSNMVLKKMINRSRPAIEHLVSVSTLSYPSGHAMCAMAFYGFLIYLTFRYKVRMWLKVVLIAVLIFLILAIGISRIYLGVHYPSDVAAGFMGGLIWVAFCVVLFNLIDLLQKRKSRKTLDD